MQTSSKKQQSSDLVTSSNKIIISLNDFYVLFAWDLSFGSVSLFLLPECQYLHHAVRHDVRYQPLAVYLSVSVCPSPAFSILLPLLLTPFHSLHSYFPSLLLYPRISVFLPPSPSPSLSPVVVIKRALCVSLQCCVIRVESEHKRERLCVWLVSPRPEEHAVPFWLGILKAQSHSCCLCVSSP